MVDAAYRHDGLVTHSPSERARLGKGQVVRIRWDAAAYKAELPKYEPAMLLITQANGFAQSTDVENGFGAAIRGRPYRAGDGRPNSGERFIAPPAMVNRHRRL